MKSFKQFINESKYLGKIVNDWRITYIDDYIVRIVNENDFETLIIRKEGDEFFVSTLGTKYTDKNYINLIKKLRK